MKNLLEEMHVLRAVRWGISAWEHDVQLLTIQSCWAHSQAVNFGQFPSPPSSLWAESEEEIELIQQSLRQMH